VVHLHAGEYAEAHEIFSAVAAETDPANECAYADAHRNVANSLIRLDRNDEAERLLIQVRRIDLRHDRLLHVVRDDGLSAFVAEQRREYELAAAAYADVQQRFEAAGEYESALLMGKSLAVVLLTADRPRDARRVLEKLLSASVPAGSERRRFTAEALAYLRELAEREQLTPDVAADVALYIDRIHVQRASPFTPPMSPLTM
jgi:tetratricopeptide (TPR) repeat protein